MQTTLWVHAFVAPIAFGLLTAHHFRRFPAASPVTTALAMVGLVVALDALLVAPVLERSWAMFRSILGTWVPFASIGAASYLAGRAVGGRDAGRQTAVSG